MDFCKAFDKVPRERLFDMLKSLEVLDDIIWAICALYEQVSKHVRFLDGLSNCFTSTIGVKQGFPQSSILLGICIDEIIVFISCKGGNRVVLRGTQVNLLLYANNIV